MPSTGYHRRMFGNSHFDNVRRLFADQFEPDGTDFLYRRSMKGAPIRVSAEQRDLFVAAFARKLRYATWSIVPLTLFLIAGLVVLVPDQDGNAATIAIYVGIIFILIPFFAGYYWAWTEPSRLLADRPVAGEAHTAEHVQKAKLQKISYGQLALVPFGAAVMVWRASAKTDVMHGWGRLWLVFAGGLLVLAGVQAFRKWRVESI